MERDRPPMDAESTAPEAEATFALSLQPSGFDARNIRLWTLADDQTKLVRESITPEGKTVDDLERSVREGETLFERMRDDYGLRVVSMDTRREKNKEGIEAVFTTVDFIEGKNLSDLKELPPESREELEQLYSSLGQYYRDAWKQKQKFWGDARSDQFVYGAKKGEEEKHFYLTDVDPEFYKAGEDKWRTIEAVVGSICHDLIENEGKFGDGVRLESARRKLLEIVEEMLAENPDWKMLIEARQWLMTVGG